MDLLIAAPSDMRTKTVDKACRDYESKFLKAETEARKAAKVGRFRRHILSHLEWDVGEYDWSVSQITDRGSSKHFEWDGDGGSHPVFVLKYAGFVEDVKCEHRERL